jgi:hypothetical protein
MSADGVASHRQSLWKPGWRVTMRLAPTPDSFSNDIYITVICDESSRNASRTSETNG